MRYDDLLQEALQLQQRGGDIEALLAAHPKHADRLRLDLAAAGSARRIAAGLPQPSARAAASFHSSLQSARDRASKPARRWPPARLSLALPAFAVAAAVAIVIAVVLVGVMVQGGTAEASVEGVVVENDGTTLTLQTADGLRQVLLDRAASIIGADGSKVGAASLEPGQLIALEARREAAGTLRARDVQLRGQGELSSWCDRFGDRCRELERIITERTDRCAQNAALCENLRQRLDLLREQLSNLQRLGEMQRVCDQGGALACLQILQICEQERPACGQIADWLRMRRGR